MRDIVERLRKRRKLGFGISPSTDEPDQDCCEAAAAIERLRQLCDARQSHLEEGGRIIDGLRQQLEECAKPLEQIRQVCADNAGEGSNHKMALDFVHQIAIRALKEQK